jgi:UDP-glucose 4-epimerase
MNKPVAIVLGGAGFIGRHVSRQLANNGYTVHAVGHGSWEAAERARWGVDRWVATDINTASLQEAAGSDVPSVLVHCGGSGTVSHSYQAPASDFSRSVDTTLSGLEFARSYRKPPCFVLASSAAVYGNQGELDMHEGLAPNPISPYGYHKLIAEQLCASYSRFFGVRTRVVRLFSVYGEGLCKQLLWDAMKKFGRGESTFFGSGDEIRDWIHVEDAARLLALAAAWIDAPHGIFNGGHVKATTRQVLSLLATAAQSLSVPTFSGEIHEGNPRHLTACTQLARDQLGFECSVDLEDGLKRYAHWFAQREAVRT